MDPNQDDSSHDGNAPADQGTAPAVQVNAPAAQGNVAATQGTANVQPGQPAAQQMIAASEASYSPFHLELDISSKYGRMLYDEGIKPLTTKFSGKGTDLPLFLTAVKQRANKCCWSDVLTFNGKNLLLDYGDITVAEIIAARNARRAQQISTNAEMRPILDAKMIYEFIYKSLGTTPQKKMITRVDAQYFLDDGPLLLKTVLDDTYVSAQSTVFSVKEKFHELHLKNYKWNVQHLNQDVRDKRVELQASGNGVNDTDTIIYLFRAYRTSTAIDFQHAVIYWKNEFDAGTWTSAEDLMRKADAKYVELKNQNLWGKHSADSQIVALPTIKSDNKSGGKNKNKNSSANWKKDRSLSSTSTYKRGDKTYHWCTGPGHNKTAMWTIHAPGTCHDRPSQANRSNGGGPSAASATMMNRDALTAMLTAKGGLSADEIESKVQAIISVFHN